jgi:hypothetical protein
MTALTYYLDTGGADTNSGTSSGTSPIANGTAATRSTNIYTLDGSPDLSGVTPNVDAIHIVGETSGRGFDGTLFEITAVDNSAKTVTVTPTPTGGTSGLTWAIGGAFATVQKALDVVDNGDKVYIKGGNYAGDNVVRTAGAARETIQLIGYTTAIGDYGQATIDGTSGSSQGINFGAGAWYYSLQNLTVQNCTQRGILNSGNRCQYFNCRILNNGSNGMDAGAAAVLVNCEATGNSNAGFSLNTSTSVIGGASYSNSSSQIQGISGGVLYKTLIYGSTGINDHGLSGTTAKAILGCTFDGENQTADAIELTTMTQDITVVDNIIYDWNVGLDWSASRDDAQQFIGYNLLNSNNTDYEFTTNPLIGYGDVTGAPNFVDEANDDYRLATGSAAIDSGLSPGGIT